MRRNSVEGVSNLSDRQKLKCSQSIQDIAELIDRESNSCCHDVFSHYLWRFVTCVQFRVVSFLLSVLLLFLLMIFLVKHSFLVKLLFSFLSLCFVCVKTVLLNVLKIKLSAFEELLCHFVIFLIVVPVVVTIAVKSLIFWDSSEV